MAKEIGKQIGRFKITDIYWLDSEQLIIVTDNHTAENGEEYNLEIQHYVDTNETIYQRVYDDRFALISGNLLTQEEIDGFSEVINNHKND